VKAQSAERSGLLLCYSASRVRLPTLQYRTSSSPLRSTISTYHIGAMTPDLIWEQYQYPVELGQLLAGNSAKILSIVVAHLCSSARLNLSVKEVEH
jgi:hypothetical protein